MTVCIFAASSTKVDSQYAEAASLLGYLLAGADIDVVFGGGGIGLMGKIADSVIAGGGKITGIIPLFMKNEGWGHPGIQNMIVTKDMSQRKKKMLEMSDAVIALPGGMGTLEELTEAITLKQLGLFHGPIIILNTLGFYSSLLEFIDSMITHNFLRLEHKGIWEVADTPGVVINILGNDVKLCTEWRKIAKI